MARGKILRDTSTGIGIISAGGVQHEFRLEMVWKSDVAPTVNMVVDFELGADGKISSVTAIDDSTLAREQAEKAMLAMKEKGSAAFADVASRVGKPVLIAVAILTITWFFLAFIKYGPGSGTDITFWNLLGIANNSGNIVQDLQYGTKIDKGIFGLLAIAALAGPFLFQFWKSPLAHLGNCLALLLIILTGIMVYVGIHDAGNAITSSANAWLGGSAKVNELAQGMADEAVKASLNSIHIAVGGIAATISAIYLAGLGIIKYLASAAGRTASI